MGSQADKLLTAVADETAELGEALLGSMVLGSAAYSDEPEYGNDADEPHIIIGRDRFMIVPDKLKRLAVQFDHNVETVTFDCPRYWDEHDMSTMKVYINYIRSDRVSGSYYVTSPITIDEDDDTVMHFNWTISREVSSANGYIAFLVCVKKTDDAGNESNHWNSELCKDCYISEGLEAVPAIVSEYPDIITYMLSRLEMWDEGVQQYVAEYLNNSDALETVIKQYVDNKYVSDKSLNVDGGFADSKAVGDKIKELYSAIEEVDTLVDIVTEKIDKINRAIPYTITINDRDQTINFADRTV